MHEGTTPAPNSPIQPLRRKYFTHLYERSGSTIASVPQHRVGGAIFTKSARELAAATGKRQSPTLPANPINRKFWIVPDRSDNASPGPSQVAAVEARETLREISNAESALQTPLYPPKTLPVYNHHAVAVQLATDTPYLLPPETPSERNIASGDGSALASMTFFEASARWLDARKTVLRVGTFDGYRYQILTLNRYFAKTKLGKIHVGHMHDYQQARIENRSGMWTKSAGPSIINHELSVVQQVLKRAKLWGPLADVYEPLPLPALQKQKVLNEAEERYLFAVAASRPEWELAFLVASLTRNTTAAGSELRNLRFEDVKLDSGEPRFTINAATAKNAFRGRTTGLNTTAKAVIERCMERARKLGSHLPEHYIFPKRITRGQYDPSQPASTSWIRSFKDMATAAGFPWLTPHCFRHMAITVMLEKGAAPETVRHIAGHVSEQMMKHYSHNRHAAQMAVLQAMDSTPAPAKKKSPAVKAQQHRFMAKGRRRFLQRRVTA